MLFEVGSLVWLKNPQPNSEQTWLTGTINGLDRKTTTEGIIKVKTDSTIFQLKFPWGETESDEIKPRNISTFTDKDDLTDLPFLNEPEMLLNLKHRFEHSKIYTNAGPILVAINPFDEVVVPESAFDVVRRFVENMKLQSSRHFEQYTKRLNHSIVLSGESGSGKTESFKILLNILGKTSDNDETRQDWFEKTLLTNRVLEAFGNATTMHTINSTRFGKLVDLTMNSRGEMVQFNTRTYLLESSRTTTQQTKERNFNIFYQLLAGASSEEKRRWKLTKPCTHYHYTNQGLLVDPELQTAIPLWEKLDSEGFSKLKEALNSIGFSPAHMTELFDIIAGVIHLGQIVFTDRNDLSGGSTITHDTENPENDPLVLAANFFGVSAEQLEEITTVRSFISRGEKIIRPLSTAAAKVARDAVAKAVYRGLFDWVVNNINSHLQRTLDKVVLDSSSSIILVDIFGFDSFQYNSMDQLCNNYSNEILQQLYNFNVFKKDVLLYREEGVEYGELNFVDNKDNIDLIANGIFRILDDQCRLPDPTDKRFVAQLYKEFNNHKLFSAIHQQQLDSKFTVQHFSGPVEYTVDDFISKNVDNLPTDTGKLLLSSTNSILVSLAHGDHQNTTSVKRRSSLVVDQSSADNNSKTSARSSATAPSFVVQVKADIQLFLKDLEPTEIHYVRCIKPFNPERNWQFNRKKAARPNNANHSVRFSNIKVTDQLRYGGILEAIKMTRMKFRAHMSYPAFFDHYRLIVDRSVFEGVKITPTTEIEKAKEIIRELLDIIADTNIKDLHGGKEASKKPVPQPPSPFPQDRRKDLRQTLSKSISKSEIQKILRSKSGDSAGPETKFSDGSLLDASKVQLGFHSVFLKVREYEILEALRNAAIVDHVVTIQKTIRRVVCQRTYKKMKKSILLLLRMTRGFTARLRVKRLKLLKKTVIILQKTFRARRLIRKANRIIRAYRCYRARKLAATLRAKKAQLTATFGPLLTARAMRWKRRGLLTLLPNQLSHGVGIISPLETRFSNYSQEEMELIGNIMALISGSRLQDTQLQGEVGFDEILKEIIVPIRLLPNENAFKNHCIVHFKKICLPEHLLKLRKLTDSTGFFGRLFGASAWSSVGKSLGSDIPLVNLDPEHGLFAKIHKVARTCASLTEHGKEEIVLLERKRQAARTSGITASPGSPSAKEIQNIDSLIGDYTTYIKAAKRLVNLLEILEKFYLHFITSFVRNYGPDSEFHRKFPSEKAYLQELIEVVRAAKRYIPTPISEEKKKEIQDSNEQQKQQVYSVGNCPLKVEWKEPTVIPASDLSAYKNNNSEVKKILTNLDLKKREFYADNLRIYEFDGIGYQFNPHDPAIGYALNSFTQFLGGAQTISARRLIKIAGTRQLLGTVTYYQAANGLKKTSLLDVLYNPVHVEQLDSFSFSLSVISCMVLGLFNLQPNNLLVDFQKNGNGMNNIKITDFNPDVMLSAEFLDFTNPNRYRIHAKNLNVLFFLPLMDEPVDPDVRAFLTSSPYMAEEIIISWLRDLYDQNRRFAALKSAGFTIEDFRTLGIPLLLPGGATIEIRRRLNRICRLLRTKHRHEEDHSPVTLSGLLESLFPALGKYYADYRADADFSEGADSDGIVSYAYVYHKALDTERSVATRKGGLFSSVAVTNANANGEQPQAPQPAGGSVLGGIFPFMKKAEQDENDPHQFGNFEESNDSGSSRSASPTVDRMQSGFSYDQVFIDDSEAIPEFHDEDPEELGMIMTANALAKSSESEGANGMVRLYSMTGPDGADLAGFSFDEVYDNENDFAQETPSPFQVLRRSVVLKVASPNVDTTAALYERQQQLAAAQQQQQQLTNPDLVPETSNPLKNARTGQRPSITATSPASNTPSNANSPQKKNTYFGANGNGGGEQSNTPSKQASRTSSNFNIGDIYNASMDEQIPTGADNKQSTPKRSSLGGPSTPASSVASPAQKRGTFTFGTVNGNNETPMALEKSTMKYEGPPEEFRQRMGAQKKAQQQRTTDRLLPPEAQRHALLLRTVEEEGFKFFNSLDFRDFADERPSGQAEEFCEIIGRNLTFMSSVWLNHINDWQFKALFRYWVKAKNNKSLLVPGLKAITRETILRYGSRTEMEQMQNCSALSKLLKRFNIQLKFAVLSAEATNTEVISQANVDRNHRKKSLAPMNPDQYDIYTFVSEHPRTQSMRNLAPVGAGGDANSRTLSRQLSTPANPGFESTDAPSAEEIAFLKEFNSDLTVEQEKISRKLYRNFWACVNKVKHSELAEYDQDIANIKELIRILVKNEPITKITIDQLRSFTDLLIVYPLLAPMAILLAERRAFSRDLLILHRLLTSPYVDKYETILFSIIENHPEVLVKPNEDFLLPCDIIKKITTERLLTYKYELLSKFIHYMTTHSTTRSFQFINKGIFSQYLGDEELLVLASFYDFHPTGPELKFRKFHLLKKDSSNHSISLLMKLLLSERDCLKTNTTEFDLIWRVYQLLLRSLAKRVLKGEITLQESEEYLWKCIDLEDIPAAYKKEKKILSMEEFEKTSRVYQDLLANWSSIKRVKQQFKLRKMASKKFINSPSPARSSGNHGNKTGGSTAKSGGKKGGPLKMTGSPPKPLPSPFKPTQPVKSSSTTTANTNANNSNLGSKQASTRGPAATSSSATNSNTNSKSTTPATSPKSPAPNSAAGTYNTPFSRLFGAGKK